MFAQDDAALTRKINFYGKTFEGIQQQGVVAGDLSAIRGLLQALEQAGLQRIMLQWTDLEDLESVEILAEALL